MREGDKMFKEGVGKSCRIFGQKKLKKLSLVGRVVSNYLQFTVLVHHKHVLTKYMTSKNVMY